MCFLMELTRALLGTAPTTVMTLFRLSKSISVGMFRILNSATVLGLSSVQSSNTFSFPPCSSMTSSTIGPTMRQGPHLREIGQGGYKCDKASVWHAGIMLLATCLARPVVLHCAAFTQSLEAYFMIVVPTEPYLEKATSVVYIRREQCMPSKAISRQEVDGLRYRIQVQIAWRQARRRRGTNSAYAQLS